MDVPRSPEVKGILVPTTFSWKQGVLNIPFHFRRASAQIVDWRGQFSVRIGEVTFENRRLDPSYRLGMPQGLLSALGKPGDALELVARPGLLVIRKAERRATSRR